MAWEDQRRNLEIASVAAATTAALLVWAWVTADTEIVDGGYFWIPFWSTGVVGAIFTFPTRLRTSGLGLLLGTLAALVLIFLALGLILGSLAEA